MWLLDTTELKLVASNFTVDGAQQEPLPYAILSHTWGDEEVSFHDIANSASKKLEGYEKIKRCCALARSQKLDTVWIDTCCIDKSSSAELSEAINSMYTWYRRSSVCYVYLSDFSIPSNARGPGGVQSDTFMDNFKSCRWFRRGWTLQELLAPFNVEFYDKDWRYLGDKSNLAHQISAATGIDQLYITDWDSVSEASVAARMSWASARQTTRLEDEAYCLMGLFDVNMPLLYGEGRKAFLRLQHEIARNSDDESLFAWHVPNYPSSALESGIFAGVPALFAGCGHYIPISSSECGRTPYTVTNKGLAMDVSGCYKKLPSLYTDRFFIFRDVQSCEYFLLPLNCASEQSPEEPFTIILKSVSKNTFVRFLPSEKTVYDKYFPHGEDTRHQIIYIRQPPYRSGWNP